MDKMNQKARVFFFFQAEDGIRDFIVTGVQTCALPISSLPILQKAENAAGFGAKYGYIHRLARPGVATAEGPDDLRISEAFGNPSAKYLSDRKRTTCTECGDARSSRPSTWCVSSRPAIGENDLLLEFTCEVTPSRICFFDQSDLLSSWTRLDLFLSGNGFVRILENLEVD